jgi:hypothetical protein
VVKSSRGSARNAANSAFGAAPEARHALREAGLFVGRGFSPYEEQAAFGAGLDRGHVVIGDAENVEHHERHRRHAPPREGQVRKPPHARVGRRFGVRQRRYRPKAAVGENLAGCRAHRHQWCQRVRGGLDRGIPEHGEHVRMAGDHPVVARGGEERTGIGEIRLAKRIETGEIHCFSVGRTSWAA